MKKPEEIVKAMEFCAREEGCFGCPYMDETVSPLVCIMTVMLDAADLLKSLLKDRSERFVGPNKTFGDQIRIGIDIPRTTTAVTYQYIYANETNVNLLIGQSSLGSAEIRKAMEDEQHNESTL